MSVLLRVAIADMRYHDLKQLEEERVYLAYNCISLIWHEGSRDRNSSRGGTWRQELMQTLWTGTAHWLAPHGLLSLLSYRTQDHQARDGTTHNGLGPPHQSLIKIPC